MEPENELLVKWPAKDLRGDSFWAYAEHGLYGADLEAFVAPYCVESAPDPDTIEVVQGFRGLRLRIVFRDCKYYGNEFGYLAQGFAKNGDLISQTICEIGARAIDKALAGDTSAN